MLRLGRAEQVAILAAVGKHPDEALGQWLTSWVKAQVEAGTNTGIDITLIPVPPKPGEPVRRSREEIENILDSIGYKELPLPQRKAIRKYQNATIVRIEETDRFPEREECWLGDHDFSDEAYNSPLWVVVVTYGKEKEEKNKWGCEDCAQAIMKSHPELANA